MEKSVCEELVSLSRVVVVSIALNHGGSRQGVVIVMASLGDREPCRLERDREGVSRSRRLENNS